MKIRITLLTASAFALAAACTPAAQEPAPATPEAAPIVETTPAAPSGPAAENTTDSLASAPTTATTPAAPAATPAPAAPAAAAGPSAAQLAEGRSTFAQSCAMCHGPTGQGTQMGVSLVNGLEVAVVKEKVTKGMVNPGDKMPPMGAALSASQLESLSQFVAAGLPQG